MSAIREDDVIASEFDVRNMPVTVAVSADGVSVHAAGPKAWSGKFAGIALVVD